MNNPFYIKMDEPDHLGNFFIGLWLGILLSIFILELIIFSAFYQPTNFAKSYEEFFCGGLKTD